TPTRFPRWVHRRLPPPPLRCARKALRSGGGALLWTTWKILAGVAERDRSGGSPAKNYGFSPASTQLGLSAGPALLGAVRDATGVYAAAVGVCIGLEVLAAVLILARP